jgi:hypothetical protein
MIDKRQFLDSCLDEIRVIKHLATKVTPGTHDWRPTSKQRSTRELLGYLATAAIVPARAMVTGVWDDSEAVEKAEAAVTPENFAAAMTKQASALEALVTGLSERDLAEKDATLPWGTKEKLGAALVVTALKTLVAYRMQLFLYAKQSGNAAIGPADCWVGFSAPTA